MEYLVGVGIYRDPEQHSKRWTRWTAWLCGLVMLCLFLTGVVPAVAAVWVWAICGGALLLHSRIIWRYSGPAFLIDLAGSMSYLERPFMYKARDAREKQVSIVPYRVRKVAVTKTLVVAFDGVCSVTVTTEATPIDMECAYQYFCGTNKTTEQEYLDRAIDDFFRSNAKEIQDILWLQKHRGHEHITSVWIDEIAGQFLRHRCVLAGLDVQITVQVEHKRFLVL